MWLNFRFTAQAFGGCGEGQSGRNLARGATEQLCQYVRLGRSPAKPDENEGGREQATWPTIWQGTESGPSPTQRELRWPAARRPWSAVVCALASRLPHRGGLVGEKPPHASPKRSLDQNMIAGRRSSVGRVRVLAGVAADGCRRPLPRHRSRRKRDFEPVDGQRDAQGLFRALLWFVRQNASLHGLLHSAPRTRAVAAPFGRLRPLPHSLVNSTLPLLMWLLVPQPK